MARSGLWSSRTTVVAGRERLRSHREGGWRGGGGAERRGKKIAFARLCNRWKFDRKSEYGVFQIFCVRFFVG